jgi:undecaprenyl-diphosphatase
VTVRRRIPGGVLLPSAALVVVLLTILVAVDWSPLIRFDRRVVKAVHPWAADHDAVRSLAHGVTHLGDPAVVTAISLVLALVLLVLRRLTDAVSVLVVRLLASFASAGLKALIDRPRPSDVPALSHVTTASYPSGHALGTAALWATILWLVSSGLGRRAVRVLAIAVPLAVAASRVLLGVHYPSDVVAGLLLGWIVAGVVTGLVGRSRQ